MDEGAACERAALGRQTPSGTPFEVSEQPELPQIPRRAGRTAVTTMAQLLATVLATPPTGRVWHFTDIHVDPLYVMNSSIHDNCNGAVINDTKGLFGNADRHRATPLEICTGSALDFMDVDNSPVDFILFTGDYTQAGLHSENLTDAYATPSSAPTLN